MNKYFTLLTRCVLSVICGAAVALIDPVTAGVIVAVAGVIYSGKKFIGAK